MDRGMTRRLILTARRSSGSSRLLVVCLHEGLIGLVHIPKVLLAAPTVGVEHLAAVSERFLHSSRRDGGTRAIVPVVNGVAQAQEYELPSDDRTGERHTQHLVTGRRTEEIIRFSKHFQFLEASLSIGRKNFQVQK